MGYEIVMCALRVLHVEDSPDDAELIRAEMEAAGYELLYRCVETGGAMRAALAFGDFDLVLSDFRLPTFDAIGALDILRASDKDIPFIIVSSCIGEETAVELMKAGAHDYVMKDNLARLLPAIERELKESKNRRQKLQAEVQLRARNELLRNMTATLGEGLMALDTAGRLMFMNAEAERLLGWSGADLALQDVHEAIHSVRSDGSFYPKMECPIVNGANRMEAYRTDDGVFVKKCGTTFPVSYVTTPIIEEGKVVANVTAFQDITARKQAEHELQESRRQLQELSVFLQSVREEERKRLARELHDELGQSLTALRFDLNWLETKFPGAGQDVVNKLATMLALVDKTVDSVRSISEDLRPGMLDDLGLAAAIEHHVEVFVERTGIACDLSMSHEDFELGSQEATAIFRLLQESLTNVTRHAQASQVMIRLHDLGKEILLIVQDNGNGLPALHTERRRKSYGLLGMNERVKMLGGQLDICSEPGKGTRIEASIPH